FRACIARTDPSWNVNYVSETIRQFVMSVRVGDVVLAVDGTRVLGIVRITGPYEYDARGDGAPPDRRRVQWLDLREWQAPVWPGRTFPEGYRRTLFQLQ